MTSQADASRPDVVSAQLAARVSGRRVLVTGLSSEVSSTWVNPDGTLSTDESSQPVQAKDADGVWRPLDEMLAAQPDGSVKPALSAAGASFAGAGSRSAARLVSAAGVTGFDWLTALPAPVLAGDTATYPNVLTGTDLTATATATGFELSLVVKAKPVSALPASISLPLKGIGLTWALSAGGVLTGATAGGKVVVTSSGAQAYDAATDPVTGMPLHSVALGLALSGTTGAQSLVVTVPTAFLNAASTVYPVTIDPSASWTKSAWAFVDAAAPTTVYYNTSSSARAGAYDAAGTHVSRSLFAFNTSNLVGKDITSATVRFNETGAAADCVARPFEVWSTGAFTSSTNWNNQPAFGTRYATITSNAGGGTGCPSATVSGDITAWGQHAVANGNGANYLGIKVAATAESTQAYFKQFGAVTISVTYNSYPSTLSQLSVSPCAGSCAASATRYVKTGRPTFSSYATDADGGQIAHYFAVHPASDASSTILTGHSTAAGNGSMSWQVPAGSPLPDGAYTYTAWAFDGTDVGPTSAPVAFTIDATAPGAPSVSSSTQPAGQLVTSSDFGFTMTGASTDTIKFAYKFDAGNYSAWVSGPNATIPNVARDALHTLSVLAQDTAGNVSAPTIYRFGGGLTSPVDEDRTQRYVTLSAAGPASYPYAAYQWRRGTTATWVSIPTGDVSVSGTTNAPAAWPVSAIGAAYTWNLASTVGGTDGLVQVRACLYTSATDPAPVCPADPAGITLAANTFGDSHATAGVGPGTVSLTTGDFQVSATDVNVPTFNGSLSIGRTLSTLPTPTETAGATGVFGPGWAASMPGTDAGAGDTTLDDQTADGYIDVVGSDGDTATYEATSLVTSYPITFAGVGNAATDGSVLTKTSATAITLTDSDGTVTSWAPSGGTWLATQVKEPGSQTAMTYTRDSAGRVTRILAPVASAAISCATPDTTAGCRSLKLAYTTLTVGGSTVTRLQNATFVAWDPQASAMSSVDVASFDYDTNGRLAHAWDPRVSPALKTAYTYDSTGRLATITPPGLAVWTLTYDTSHRLVSASRPDPSGSTAITTVAYGVPTSGAGAPVDLSAAAAATWGQVSDLPVPGTTGTAVFGPDHVPAGAPTTTDWPYASLSFTDVNGREVNTATYGAGQWLIDTTRYDSHGNDIWSLTAGNRAQALNPTTDTDPAAAAASGSAAAELLASKNVYNTDGSEITDTFGPIHPVQLVNGTLLDARAHTHTDYDQGAPATGGPYRLPTTITSTVQGSDGTDYDARITRTGYDIVNTADPNEASGWTLHQATTTTTQMGPSADPSADLVRISRYNQAGQVIESRLPGAAAGGSAGDTVTSYYAPGASGACVSTALAGLLCSTGPAAQPTTGNPLPITSTTYNRYDQPLTATETAGTTIRTTTTSYDPAGRPAGLTIAVTPAAAGGTALPAVTTTYDSATGLPTTVSAGGKTLTTGYDNLGRTTSYTDATGNTATSTYDIAGRVTTANDGKGSTTYTYDSATEHRGLVTAEDVGVGTAPGVFTAAYDPEGNAATVTYPNGLTATTGYDNTGSDTALTYTKSGATWLSFIQTPGSDGATAAQTSPASAQQFGYDNAGRLTRTQDTVPDPATGAVACTTRTYTVDKNSNRTSLNSYPDDNSNPSTGNCTTTTTPTAWAGGYDQADRLTNTGYTYDTMGRTTTLPAADAHGIGTHTTTGDVTIGYYTNDLVATQSQGGRTLGFTLDPSQTRFIDTTDTAGATTTNHYADSGDSPAWTSTSATAWTRNLIGIAGGLAGTIDQTGTVTLDLANMHGDIVATCPDDTGTPGISSYSESTEYGAPRDVTTAPDTYGWLGTKQRSTNDLAGLTLMGVRLYNPTTGRFLSVDPVPGGNDNPYIYVNNPTDQFDLDGNCRWCHRAWRWASHHKVDIALTVASFVVPEATGAIWAYRSYRLYRAIEAGEDGYRATRATSWGARRLWLGRGASRTVTRSGGTRWVSRSGARSWRSPSYKGRRGWESNFDSNTPRYRTQHVQHRRWWW
ncbi:RHS repeat-associated core domain-containing protein [Jatrophihabitans lederbergiae]|uniref:RHS repeat-associated core domain-containing protein n=1 Tax=Jatrophihabitans lederbergiae TaxID=3075547 RepID=A0ABU2JDC6_9ACTN|nr:RHS repeat-associated core domain-containing protein [Jatrophihabitans sp. DSM 44399]MDT0262980.1 RHS repeat-associated core domain-containing protein [Jatrophihabitans sp. DSM 44399]